MKRSLITLLSISFSAHASYPELFGSSAGSMSIGNQAEQNSASNNYYAAALLGYSNETKFSFNSFYVATDFREIQSVTIKNQTNTVNQNTIGDVEVNQTPTAIFGAHLSTPLFSGLGPKLNLSVFAPFDRLMEADSGDPYMPNYAMYENRYSRPSTHFSLAQSFQTWSFSLGAQTGLQSNGEAYLVTRTTAGNPSLGKISFNAKPSIGIVASIAKKFDHQVSYLSFQQEMKSKFQNHATGETEIASNSSFPFDFKITSLLYYDPMIVRAGHQMFFTNRSIFISLEYQQWDSYESTTLKLQKQGGTINGSQNYENLKLKNILIPKIGHEEKLSDQWSLKFGYFYRPSPIKTSNLKNAGNTIDVEKHVGSIGAAYNFKFLNKILTVDLAYQGHLLKNGQITKTPGREDGNTSESKIGSPGYRVGGMIHSLGLGISWAI